MHKDVVISEVTKEQLPDWLEAGIALRGDRHLRRLLGFAQDVEQGRRVIWAAWENGQLRGQITLQYASEYPPFRRQGVCEIVDVWVDAAQRRQGIAKALLAKAVAHASEKNAKAIGLGVGVTENFGPAHRLYAQAGFMPDGTGLWVQGHAAKMDDVVTLGDGVLLMWVKPLFPSPLVGEGQGEGAVQL